MSDLFSAVDVTFCFNAHSWRKTVGDSLRYCTARIASVVIWKLLSCVRPHFFLHGSLSVIRSWAGYAPPAAWCRLRELNPPPRIKSPVLCQLSEYGMKKARCKTASCLIVTKIRRFSQCAVFSRYLRAVLSSFGTRGVQQRLE